MCAPFPCQCVASCPFESLHILTRFGCFVPLCTCIRFACRGACWSVHEWSPTSQSIWIEISHLHRKKMIWNSGKNFVKYTVNRCILLLIVLNCFKPGHPSIFSTWIRSPSATFGKAVKNTKMAGIAMKTSGGRTGHMNSLFMIRIWNSLLGWMIPWLLHGL